jgi:dolichyl-phosphate-mannose--protein O-mannosyl transferase
MGRPIEYAITIEVNVCSSCYGTGTPEFEGDANDFWRVQILDHDKRDSEAGDRLRTLNSKFQLIHVNSNCALFSHGVKLPEARINALRIFVTSAASPFPCCC